MNDYKEKFLELEKWIINNPLSYDLLDIKNIYIFHKILKLSQISYFFKIITAPFIIIAERKPNLLRKIFNVKKKEYAQGHAIIARAYLVYYKQTNEKEFLEKAEEKLKWLINNRSKKTKYYGWGQPYNWYARETIPAFTPRATVSTQVANAFIDAYEITGKLNYLEIAQSTCEMFINEFGWDKNNEGLVCFSYTSQDKYHIHNANMLVSATLIRVWHWNKNEKFKEFGIKAMKFTLQHQNSDGSWFYWSLPDKVLGRIDNYHTGFILESLEINRQYLGEEFVYYKQLDDGIHYYINNLFKDGIIPKLTNKSLYPIDIQSCAQAIITFGELSKYKQEYLQIAKNVYDWTYTNMYDKEGFYYYRIFKNGRIDKTPYIRWSESWMLRALTYLTKL